MNKTLVLNASPIILLGKAGLLKIISPISKIWIIPEGVIKEIERKSPIDPYLSELSSQATVKREKVSKIHPLIASWDLGQGEGQVLTLALKSINRGPVLDDLQARKCARLFEIPLIGSLGLIVAAKRRGVLPAVKPAFDQIPPLCCFFYFNSFINII